MNSLTNNEIPEYLSKKYVENFLKKYYMDSTLKVLNILATPASGKGEAFCSIMTRMKVNYTVDKADDVKEIVFLIKSKYENDSLVSDVLCEYDIYNTEMQMYETVFPQLQQLLQEIDDTDQLCAKTIHVDYEREIIVLEDLSVRNFSTQNRLNGMNEVIAKLCLRKLAKMHATAAVLNERQAGVLEKYSRGLFNRHVSKYNKFIEGVIAVCAKFAESCPELGIYYRDKLLKLIPHFVEYATRCYDPNPKHFFTLNHGDLWTNNVMVQIENFNVKDALLIDFQYCNWTSPAVDLHYFFSTSTEDDVYLNHLPSLIQYYHQILSETLKKLNYKQHIPTLLELNVQLLERGFYAVCCLLVNFAFLINDKTEDAELETVLGCDEKSERFRRILYENKRVQKMIKIMLPKFDKMGLLEVVK